MNNFKLTKETLPIFASLCGNNEFKITDFSKDFQDHFYSILKDENNNRTDTDFIIYDYYRNIVNFILNIYDKIKERNELKETKYIYKANKLSPLQEVMNKEITKNIFNDHLKKFYISIQRKFRNNLDKAVKEYNSIFYNDSNISNETETVNSKESSIKSIINKNEGDSFFCSNDFIKNRVFSLDEQILESYYRADYNVELLNGKN